MAELHLAESLRTIRDMFAPYEGAGVAFEPLAVSAMLAMLDAAAGEA